MEKTEFIFVNLLPYRQKIKDSQIKKFALLMSAFGLISLFFIVFIHILYSFEIDTQEGRNNYIDVENKKLDEKIQSIISLKEEIKSTLEKRKIVEGLQINRADGVNIINELANNLPDGASLKNFKKIGDKIIIVGQTSSNNKVSNYMTALGESVIFVNPNLIEIKAIILQTKSVNSKKSEDVKLNEFTITVDMKKSVEETEFNLKNKNKSAN